jgi:hypothetical protein
MNRRRTAASLSATALLAALTLGAHSPRGTAGRIVVGYYSQQEGNSRAVIGADVGRSGSARPTGSMPGTGAAEAQTASAPGASGSVGADQPPPYPTLPADSPLLQNPSPFGPGSFWYQDATGQVCGYLADASPACYTITAAGAATPAVAIPSPAVLAAQAADQLALSPGTIYVSPESKGLTGAPSWFWLNPAPEASSLSVSVAGEVVSVTALPQIEWQFGDGATLNAGPGVPYSSGPVPAAAVTHVYQTRCLPGDQGSNPYVLPGCSGDGYPVNAVVTWQISYQAAGAISEEGVLSDRTTTATIGYPVSEARAFLTGATGP